MKWTTAGLAVVAFVSLFGFARAELGLISVMLEGMRDKCFVEELPEKTILMIKHEAALLDINSKQPLTGIPFQIMVTVRDPAGHTIIRQQHKPDHKLFMTSTLAGEYTVCFQNMPTQYVPNAAAKLALEIFIGEDHETQPVSQVENKLNQLSVSISENNRLIADIEVEQQLQRSREAEFRKVSEGMLSLTFYFALLQTLVLAGTVYMQARNLQKFFQYKKIV